MSKKKIFITVQQPATPEKPIDNGDFYLSLSGLIVNIILAAVAIYVLFLTRRQTQASIDSVAVAKQVFEDSKKYNEETFKFQKQQAEDALADTKKQFELQNAVIQSQIKALEDTQTRFEIENEPYLEIKNYSVLMTSSTSEINIVWEFTNFGKHPVKIYESRQYYSYNEGYTVNDLVQLLQTKSFIPSNKYISRESPSKSLNLVPSTAEERPTVYANRIHPFLSVGEVHYINLITNKKKLYRYVAQARNVNSLNYELLKSENENIPE